MAHGNAGHSQDRGGKASLGARYIRCCEAERLSALCWQAGELRSQQTACHPESKQASPPATKLDNASVLLETPVGDRSLDPAQKFVQELLLPLIVKQLRSRRRFCNCSFPLSSGDSSVTHCLPPLQKNTGLGHPKRVHHLIEMPHDLQSPLRCADPKAVRLVL